MSLSVHSLRVLSAALRATILALAALPLALDAQSPDTSSRTTNAAVDHGFTNGVYVGAIARADRVALQRLTLPGFELSWIGAHRFAFGIAAIGNGWVPLINPRAAASNAGESLEFGYGGVTIGYVHPLPFRFRISAQVLAGAGALNYRSARGDPARNSEANTFAVVEPVMRVQIIALSFIRVSVDAAYRLTSRVTFDGLTTADVRGHSLGMSLQLGNF